jgi:hypothetical protein
LLLLQLFAKLLELCAELFTGFVGGACAYTTKAVESSDLSERSAEMEKKSKAAKK